MAKRIDVGYLRELGASCEQVETFAAEWPDGCEVNEDNLRRAIELGLDVDWFAKRVLPADAWAEYERATAPAQIEYGRALDAARDGLVRAPNTNWVEYKRALDAAWVEYKRAWNAAMIAALVKWSEEGLI